MGFILTKLQNPESITLWPLTYNLIVLFEWVLHLKIQFFKSEILLLFLAQFAECLFHFVVLCFQKCSWHHYFSWVHLLKDWAKYRWVFLQFLWVKDECIQLWVILYLSIWYVAFVLIAGLLWGMCYPLLIKCYSVFP